MTTPRAHQNPILTLFLTSQDAFRNESVVIHSKNVQSKLRRNALVECDPYPQTGAPHVPCGKTVSIPQIHCGKKLPPQQQFSKGITQVLTSSMTEHALKFLISYNARWYGTELSQLANKIDSARSKM